MLTQEIIQTNVARPIHAWSMEELVKIMVSSKSTWYGPKWELDNPTHGATNIASTVFWDIDLDEGDTLLSQKYRTILDWLRRVVFSLMDAPGDDNRPLAPGSMSNVNLGLKKVVPWLIRNHVYWPHQITQLVCEQFENDLPQIIGKSDVEDEEVAHSMASLCIHIFVYIWRQRRALEDAGIQPMLIMPWAGKPVREIANRICESIYELIHPCRMKSRYRF